MRSVLHIVLEVLQTALRLLPWPTTTGLRTIGHPTPDSPVLLTCNYDLTVRRLIRTLRGEDAWLVVAPSAGVNVWCAAAGGHFGTHQIVMALKTCGVSERVNHRNVIVPQLAATGVVSRDVRKRAGWRVLFGPVYAHDLPEYLHNGHEVTEPMRHVVFSPRERFEMAMAWAAPTCLIAGGAMAFFRGAWAALTVVLVTVLGLAVFYLYRHLGPYPRTAIMVGATVLSGLSAAVFLGDTTSVVTFLVAGPVLALILTVDYPGSTPIEHPSWFDESNFNIALDSDRCVGVYRCDAVCPENVFERDVERRKVTIDHPERCIRCAACIVQCPADALFLEDPHGNRIEPDTIRQYKLNLFGHRAARPGA